ncbi:MAG: hypothetical protein ACRERD_14350 [Candidatus Binatia bacterium]
MQLADQLVEHATDLSEEQAKLMEQGLETFVGVLGNMVGEEEPRR